MRRRRGKGFINKLINRLPIEMHLPGHQFTGPGTQLLHGKTRLNPDLTYKAWSKPINRVDQTAYKHDICYLKNKDTKLGTRSAIKKCSMNGTLFRVPHRGKE